MRVVRPEFRRMLDDLESGLIDAIIVYDLDRLARDLRDLEDLIDVKESKRIEIRSVSGSLRLDNDGDITMARVLVTMANKSSRDTSRRVKRAARQRAETGGFHGGRVAFGYEQHKDAAGKVTAWTPHPVHAGWVREAAERLLNGEALYSICMDFTRQGRTSATGGHWNNSALRRIVQKPAVIGCRERDGVLYPASWEPILDRETWERLRVLLGEQKARRTPRTTAHVRKHALKALLFCDLCKKPMTTQSGQSSPSYVCAAMTNGGCGKVAISVDRIEPWVLAQTIEVLGKISIDRGENVDPEIKSARAAIDQDQRALDKATDDHYAGLLSRDRWLRACATITGRLETNQRVLDDLIARSTRTVIPTGAELASQWGHRDALWKQQMLSAVIERIWVKPHPVGTPRTLTRRLGESDESLTERRRANIAASMDARLDIRWRA